jgi:hypothetical protein
LTKKLIPVGIYVQYLLTHLFLLDGRRHRLQSPHGLAVQNLQLWSWQTRRLLKQIDKTVYKVNYDVYGQGSPDPKPRITEPTSSNKYLAQEMFLQETLYV